MDKDRILEILVKEHYRHYYKALKLADNVLSIEEWDPDRGTAYKKALEQWKTEIEKCDLIQDIAEDLGLDIEEEGYISEFIEASSKLRRKIDDTVSDLLEIDQEGKKELNRERVLTVLVVEYYIHNRDAIGLDKIMQDALDSDSFHDFAQMHQSEEDIKETIKAIADYLGYSAEEFESAFTQYQERIESYQRSSEQEEEIERLLTGE